MCQLSTNDATKNLPLGEVSSSTSAEDFDMQTVTGALEYIIATARTNWNCPIMIMAGSQYDSEVYPLMVERVHELQEKWQIGMIDLWNNVDVNSISAERKAEYTSDGIHPTMEGYRDWWGPAMEEAVLNYLGNQ